MLSRRYFESQLKSRIDQWVDAGLIPAEAAGAIRNFERERPAVVRLPLVLYTLGAVLLGVGIATWVAANWDVIGRLVKVTMLLGLLWACYGVSAWVDAPNRPRLLAPAGRLLGVLLFGANIQLIAQIYHIEAHFPNGILLWALGGVLAAWVLKDQGSVLVALLMASIWTSLEVFEFGYGVHWPYLIVWALCLPPILRHGWQPAFLGALAGLGYWALLLMTRHDFVEAIGGPLFLLQLYFLAALTLAALGRVNWQGMTLPRPARPAWLTAWWDAGRGTALDPAPGLIHFGLVAALLAFYALTFPDVQDNDTLWGTGWQGTPLAIGAHGVILAGLAALWFKVRGSSPPALQSRVPWDDLLLAAVGVLLLTNLFVTGDLTSEMAAAFNVVFFAGLIRLILRGMVRQDRFQVNLGFIFFGLTLLNRYFDVFWSLLSRSYFFMGGGLLVLVGGWLLDRQRRRLLATLTEDTPAGSTP